MNISEKERKKVVSKKEEKNSPEESLQQIREDGY